jgi:hypothetical protein
MNIKMWFKQKKENKKGFTLLFAVLVSTLVVAIGATVVSIALRQTILSGTSRESQYAFYAANTVLECAFFWDVIGKEGAENPVFPGNGETGLADVTGGSDGVTCSGGNIITGSGFTGENDFASGGWTTYPEDSQKKTIYIAVHNVVPGSTVGQTYCAEATITKSDPDPDNFGIVTTTIEAKGYNTCDLTNPRAVERGLRQSYES